MTPASILVIDDDAPFARSVQILLEDEGHHNVVVATSSGLALAALGAIKELDVMIIDLAMIGTHDTELGREIRDHHSRVAVIVMTAHAAALDAARSRWVDAAGFLTKPVDPSTLLAMVSSALCGERCRTADPARHRPPADSPC